MLFRSTEKGDFLGPRGRRFLIAPGSPLRNRAPRWMVAAHIVETQRIYARLVAAVEPEWIESAARHLVRREYTDPEWEEGRGMVACRETITLWGLPLVAGRRTNYGAVAPREAREVFAREALVHGRARLKVAALQQNRQTKARLAAEESALRRHTVLIEETDEAALYVARLPEAVHSVAAFERWRKTPAARDGDALVLTEDDLRQPGEKAIDRKAYPLQLNLAGNRLPVRYRFEPQEAADGAIVTVPVALVPRLSEGELAWGIPGWRTEKVTAIIRGLPKPLDRKSTRLNSSH